MIRRPASLHAVPRCGGVPALHRRGFASPFGTIRALRLPAARPAALRFPSLGGTVDAFTPFRSRRPRERPAGGPGLVEVRPARAEMVIDGDDRISQVPGEPPLHLRRALRPRQDHGV
jgi:hypothetical protein